MKRVLGLCVGVLLMVVGCGPPFMGEAYWVYLTGHSFRGELDEEAWIHLKMYCIGQVAQGASKINCLDKEAILQEFSREAAATRFLKAVKKVHREERFPDDTERLHKEAQEAEGLKR